VEEAFVARHELSYENAARWVRHRAPIWIALESDYVANGRSGRLDAVAWTLLGAARQSALLGKGAPQVTDGEFRAYVATLRPAEP
jgi:hypothetical protein